MVNSNYIDKNRKLAFKLESMVDSTAIETIHAQVASLAENCSLPLPKPYASSSLLSAMKAMDSIRDSIEEFSPKPLCGMTGVASLIGADNVLEAGLAGTLASIREIFDDQNKAMLEAVAALNEQMALPAKRLAESLATINESFALPIIEAAGVKELLGVPPAASFTTIENRPRPNVGETIERRIAQKAEILPLRPIDEGRETDTWARHSEAHEWLCRYDDLIVDVELRRITRKFFADGHYAIAAEKAFNYLDFMIREKSGEADLHGASLMRKVFNGKNPILQMNSLSTHYEENVQEGYSHICAGAMMAIRGPRGT